MHALNNALVPVLRRFTFRISNGENRRIDALPGELSHFSIAERLPKRREPLKEVRELCHRRELTDVCKMTKSECGSSK